MLTTKHRSQGPIHQGVDMELIHVPTLPYTPSPISAPLEQFTSYNQEQLAFWHPSSTVYKLQPGTIGILTPL